MEKLDNTKWLDAFSDGSASLRTISTCMNICDLKNDNYYKLIVAEIPNDFDSNSRLRVYKGTQVVNDQMIFGIPSSIQSVYIEESAPKIPIVAISVGPSVLFYRNMKPYFKYTVPSLLITPIELDVWNKLSSDRPINYEKHINELRNVAFSQLTVLSQKLLKIQNDERENFIKENCDPRLQRLPNIIGLNAIYKNIEDEKSPNCLIITTDAGDVLIMDIQSFNIVHQARVCNFNCTPDLVSAQGSFTNDFRIVISTREATICIIRKNWYEGREIIKLEKSATSLCLLPVDQTIAVVCGDKLMCYSKKGKLLWSVKTKERVLSMTPMSLPYLGISMVCVGLKDGSIQIYSKKSLVDELNVNDPVSAMIFGKLGQEEHVLTMVTQSGSLIIKILRRNATFNEVETVKETIDHKKNFSIAVPKKSNIFIEQTLREKENAQQIHNIFQTDLWRMRLTAAKITLHVLKTGDSTFSGGLHTPIKLLSEIYGVGPQFTLALTLENMSATNVVTNLSILFHANTELYKIENVYSKITPLIPGFPIAMEFKVTVRVSNDNIIQADLLEKSPVRILLIKEGLSKPLIASTIVFPKPEMENQLF